MRRAKDMNMCQQRLRCVLPFTALLLLVLPLHAVVRADEHRAPRARSVKEFLTPAGTFDLEACRQSGFEGSLDLAGMKARLDPATDAPTFAAPGDDPLASSAQGDDARDEGDENWWGGFGWPGVNGTVYALTVYDGDLIVGGQFTEAGGGPANNIARWDGTSWNPIGSGVNHVVYALAVYDGSLIAGGLFTQAGGVAANYIACWDGSGWSSLGSGTNEGVTALTAYGGDLVAGGYFFMAGGISANYIARWNGSSWSALGSGMNSYVNALGVYDE